METIIGITIYLLIGICFSLIYLKTNNGSLAYQMESAKTDSMFVLIFWPVYAVYKFIDLLNRYI